MQVRPFTIVLLLVACGSSDTQDRQVGDEAEPGAVVTSPSLAAPGGDTTTHVMMRNVDFHLPRDVILQIRMVEGEVRPLVRDQPIIFDDVRSFAMHVKAGVVALSMSSLERLMNDWVFAYEDAPLRDFSFDTAGNRLRMKGTLDAFINIPFEVEATPEMTSNGEIVMKPHRIRTAGAVGTAVRDLLGLELEEVVDLSGARGIRVEGDLLYLDPSKLLPPPRIEGTITDIRVESGQLVQRFGSLEENRESEQNVDNTLEPDVNEMRFRGGLLGFGKLRMIDADLRVVDLDGRDIFDFSIVEYQKQLVAGFSRNTPVGGLDVFMPDLDDMERRKHHW